MGKYIDKSALVEEINNWIKDAKRKYTMSKVQFSLDDRIKSLENLLSFLDTLEVKEVDLEKEFDNYTKDIWSCDIQDEPFTSLYNCAKHFFELGIKAAQKGE